MLYPRVKDNICKMQKTPSNTFSVIKESLAADHDFTGSFPCNRIKKFSSKPAILSLTIQTALFQTLSPELPDVLSNLCDKSFPDVDNLTLLKKTKEIVKELQVNKKQRALVVERTRDRANSKL